MEDINIEILAAYLCYTFEVTSTITKNKVIWNIKAGNPSRRGSGETILEAMLDAATGSIFESKGS